MISLLHLHGLYVHSPLPSTNKHLKKCSGIKTTLCHFYLVGSKKPTFVTYRCPCNIDRLHYPSSTHRLIAPLTFNLDVVKGISKKEGKFANFCAKLCCVESSLCGISQLIFSCIFVESLNKINELSNYHLIASFLKPIVRWKTARKRSLRGKLWFKMIVFF